MSENVVFRNVWQRKAPEVRREAIAAWQAAGDRLGKRTPEERARALCVAGFDGKRICALSTCEIAYFPLVRENMAFIQVFVVPDYREKGLVVPLTLASHDVMSKFALAHPDLRIGGTAGRVTVTGTMDKPVTNAGMVLVGYTVSNEPMLLRWFDHFKLDEEAARARVSGRSASRQ